ncbi:hypothetical protein N7510_005454 [Penicillium lagena]|uniref:uncharacterized protein n=1 Tax=Penicillium lagena TaxID=94218 RepID=UPI0025400EEC|nr:uncharacterized protein N7510_005454 [Penicillium lagena]KAJ5612260.1 hypothetical protein N7510_005454 [Penicillium lagena]
MDKNKQIVIVGAGAFGLSTALKLAQEGYRSVTVLDRAMPPVPDGSSVDISRIIRFDYGDVTYAHIAKEAYDLWKDSPDYKDAFHSAPCVWISHEATPDQVIQPRAAEYSLKTKQVLTNMGQEWHALRSGAEARKAFPTLTGNMDAPGWDGFYNTAAGWADAGAAVAQLAARCISAGVSIIAGPNGQVSKFEEREDGTIRAVRTVNGNKIDADLFIVAAGAWCASLIPAWNSMLAAGQIVGYLRLTPSEVAKLKDLPIYFNFSTGFFCFPAHEASGYLKVACHGYGYTSSETGVSAPPIMAVSSRANFIPADGVRRLLAGLKDILPELVTRGFERVGLCWYNDTPTGDFIMDYHPQHKNMFICTGGSGHGFKFLPVIGKYAVGCLERTLPTDLIEKWKFPTQFRNEFQENIFTGDGSRGGPARREMTNHERNSYSSAARATVARQSKI